ncbi:Uncharacterised protein [Vibrio cholerae]|nr:Uncharacterised protein [Vibrio cholerae]CSI96586.1 Uncharacterised protein [Vibrio cholerae]
MFEKNWPAKVAKIAHSITALAIGGQYDNVRLPPTAPLDRPLSDTAPRKWAHHPSLK